MGFPHLAMGMTTAERGYGGQHQKLRATIDIQVKTGKAYCSRCLKPIGKDEHWDLGHDDNDRTKYTGPEHVDCNRGAPRRKQATNVADNSRMW